MADTAHTPETQAEQNVLWLFDIALLLKLLNGALELIGGILIIFVPHSLVLRLAEFATNGELTQDPTDVVARFIINTAHAFTVGAHYFIALYLILHGIVKVLLVIGIFAKKKIAYPLFMLALAVFGAYEAYRGFARHELLLQALAVFDFALLLLTSYEYRQRYPKDSGITRGSKHESPPPRIEE